MHHNNNAAKIRMDLLIRVAHEFMRGRLDETARRIPFEMRPKEMRATRCCVYKDRAVIKYRTMAAMGISPESETDELTSTNSYARDAIAREKPDETQPTLSVIDIACSACVESRFLVTNACRGCMAHPCSVNCPKKCIDISKGKAEIDPESCINCGKCVSNCPYSAIIRLPVPCEDACSVSAIHKDHAGRAVFDREKCVSCGHCMTACPFGAIVETSQMIDVLKALQSGTPVIGMLAPAFIGQFPQTIEKLAGGMKKLGFNMTAEVAVGADMTAEEEAKEYIERREEGADFMTTSCCPAYVGVVEKHLPDLKPFVSHTPSPMVLLGRHMREEFPDAKTVFIGPCSAKREEAKGEDSIDFVLTFEELGALFVAADILLADCDDEKLYEMPSSGGRGFAVAGGVTGALKDIMTDEQLEDLTPEAIDGVTPQVVKKLSNMHKRKQAFSFLEVMMCEGGCVAGPGNVTPANKCAAQVKKFCSSAEKAPKLTE